MPPTGRFLLDTNIIIALLGGEPAVAAGIRQAEAVFVPAIALGELYYGARKSGRSAQNLDRLEALAAAAAVLPCDAVTAALNGALKADLRARGMPIPENDLWIAAVGQQHQLTLVTRDAHFSAISGLARTSWA